MISFMPKVELAPVAGRWKGWRRAMGVAVAAVVATWVFGLLGPLSLLVPVIPVALIVMRRPWVAGVCLMLSSIGVGLASGVIGYCTGDAYMLYEGLPGTESHNLDPELRCGHATSGCIVSGNEWLTHGPNNLAVRKLTQWFGPQRGTYRGPYPSAEEALAAVAHGREVPLAELRADAIRVGDRVVRLDFGVGAGLLRAAGAIYDPIWPAADLEGVVKEFGPIRATVWRDSCLIVRIPVGPLDGVQRDGQRGPQSACVAVCDLVRGRPFAYYAEGSYYHRFPPVTWHRR